ncbi:MAG: hypothetical protein HKO63_02915 [Acidimicrobiia bacterium]|nr:hypothetical protein [Acidimicrobiia bacterium]
MRGTGYAIGEILIFLAIAAIIGFLIGWVVFYRRPDKGSSQLSPVNPNHVRRLEERSKAVDAKLVRIEKRASALLALLSKAPRPDGAGEQPASVAPDAVIAPAAAAPVAKATDEAEDAATEATNEAEDAATAEDTAEDAATEATDEAEDAATDEGTGEAEEAVTDEDTAKDTGPDEAEKEADEVEAKAAPDEATPGEPAGAGEKAKDVAGEGVDDYLSEADDRISKLEETLDKLSEKLAELEDD